MGSTAPPVPAEATSWLSDGADWATIIAAVGTLVAALIAFLAILEARRLNTEKSQPYVVASLEPHDQVPWFMELVVRNLGQTAATDVVLRFDPQPVRTRKTDEGEQKPILLPDSFPVLVPGQRWSTSWDSIFDRHKSDLPKRHEVTITYKGIDGKEQTPTRFVLDWDTYFNRGHLGIKTLNNVAQELSGINSQLQKMLSPELIHQVELVEVNEDVTQAVPRSQVVGGSSRRKNAGSALSSLVEWIRSASGR